MISNPFKLPSSDERAAQQLETAKQQYQQHKSQESYHKHMAAYCKEQIDFYQSLLMTDNYDNI